VGIILGGCLTVKN